MNAVATPPSSLEALADDLVASCRGIPQHAFRFLVLLREFDLRRGYREARGKGRCADNSADWLNARCRISGDIVREGLRVAYALLNLPAMESALEAGKLSFAQVQSLTEVATHANEQALLDTVSGMTGAEVAVYCRQLRGRLAVRHSESSESSE